MVSFEFDLMQEDDGRWLACLRGFPGITSYGVTTDEAVRGGLGLALKVFLDNLIHRELELYQDYKIDEEHRTRTCTVNIHRAY